MSTQFTFGIFCAGPRIEQYIAEYNRQSRDRILATSATFSEAVRIARAWEAEGAEVLISRRATGDILRNSVKTPVLSLPFSDIENLRSLNASCKSGMRILVPAYKRRAPILGLLGRVLGVIILQKIYSTELELRHLVRSAAKDSVDCVAGGHATALLAGEYGVSYVALPPSKEQIHNILDSARDVARSNREKELLLSESECIMNAMIEGLVCIDAQGNIISLNERARSFFRNDSAGVMIGASFVPCLGENTFARMTRQRSRVHNEYIVEIDKKIFVVHMTRLHTKHEAGRMLLTLRKQQDVLRQSQAINISASSGFVAGVRFEDLVYKDERMENTVELCKIYAKSSATVLIIGETGTGKEMLAQGIHNHSSRSNMPFVSINCAELPEPLLESELFGYEEGAFTGSRKGGKAGLFELADKGTIFLDEICSASASVQAKLLRVMQEKELMRIGGTRKIYVDVRVIATSGRKLWQFVLEKGFRKDLFFRLNVMNVRIPPLRERIDDLDVLLPHFFRYFSKKEKCPLPSLNKRQTALLKRYAWPGNVRQLRNFSERFVLHSMFMSEPFSFIYNELQELSPDGRKADQTASEEKEKKGKISWEEDKKTLFPLPENRWALLEDPHALRKLMEAARYSKKEAAGLLGVSRSTLWRKLKQWNI
ncbi:MAG: sigma 54-interacting transcriptional regulator [Desulfovibrio sp.]|jgi:transcriptional regulator with PAS, ATPase and Fis domain|nr:sigma 54-interacting transcriptional regulator [Desulfovibrio sp.]